MQLPVSRDVNVRQKSKMAAAKMKCTYFTAVWLTEDNFKYPVDDFQCPRHRCADPGMPLMTDMGKTKIAAETGSSFFPLRCAPPVMHSAQTYTWFFPVLLTYFSIYFAEVSKKVYYVGYFTY